MEPLLSNAKVISHPGNSNTNGLTLGIDTSKIEKQWLQDGLYNEPPIASDKGVGLCYASGGGVAR